MAETAVDVRYVCYNDDCKAEMRVCQCLRNAMHGYKIKQKAKESKEKWTNEVIGFYDETLTLLGFDADAIIKENETYLELGRVIHGLILNKIRKLVKED